MVLPFLGLKTLTLFSSYMKFPLIYISKLPTYKTSNKQCSVYILNVYLQYL